MPSMYVPPVPYNDAALRASILVVDDRVDQLEVKAYWTVALIDTSTHVRLGFYKGLDMKPIVPAVVAGLPVTAMDSSAFDSSNVTLLGLKTVTFPASMAYLGRYCFYGNSQLTGLYFEGNAPTVHGQWKYSIPAGVKIYKHAGAEDFGDVGDDWNGLEVAEW